MRVDALRSMVGQRFGPSGWFEITQERVDRFAEATGDLQWIHVDPERAARGVFGGTVAHGYLILSLAPRLLAQILPVDGFAMRVNYGCDRVRFLSPVPVGAALRAEATLRAVDGFRDGVQLTLTLVYRIRGRQAPVCVARIILRNYVDRQ